MFFHFGSPLLLSSISQDAMDLNEAKNRSNIAVLDDNQFHPKEALTNHNFRITELGPDIRSLDQISSYPIIVCDVGGVGRAFGSNLEGAHIVQEIRKAYPDKFIIAYTGMTFSVATTNALTSADKRMEKDASLDAWVQTLENGIKEVINPRARWVRLRRALLERGVEIFDIFKLEQAFIQSIRQNKPTALEKEVKSLGVSSDITEIIIKFAARLIADFIKHSIEN